MYCPQCGQAQLSEDVRFCSQCGFPLTEVIGLLTRGGTPAFAPEQASPRDDAPPKYVSPRKRGLKQSAYIVLAAFVLLFFMAVANADGDAVATIFMLWLVAAFLRMLYALVFQRGKPRQPAPAPVGPPPNQLYAPPGHAAPRAPTNPVAVPRTRFDTGEIVEPPSVTEHTTRHLEQERPPERDRIRRD